MIRLTASIRYLLTTAFIAVLIAAFAMRTPALIVLAVALSATVIAANPRAFATANVRERNVLVLFCVVLTAMLPTSVLRGETAMLHYLVSLSVLGAAFVLTRDLQLYLVASRLSLAAAQLAVLVYLFKSGLANFPLEDLLPESSSNVVTSYLVVMQANYCVVNYLLNRRASLLTAAVTLFICFVGFGRGSLLAAGALVVLGLLSQVHARSQAQVLLRILMLIAGMAVAYLLYRETIVETVAGTKIGSGLYDETRMSMIADYLGKMDAGTVLTGASYDGTNIASDYNGNPHNSFIRAHHIFGLPYVLLVLLLPLYLTRGALPPAVRMYSACVWLVVLLRSFTEPVLFPTLFDYYYFSVCFALSRQLSSTRPDAAATQPVMASGTSDDRLPREAS